MEDKIKEIIKEAERITLEANVDPSIKQGVFSEVFNLLWKLRVDNTISKEEKTDNNGVNLNFPVSDNFWSSLSSRSKINEDKLRDIFDIRNKQIFLVLRDLPGDSKVVKRRNLAILVLFAYQEGLSMPWILSTLLAEAAKNSKLYDRSHFAENLNHEWFRSKGSGKGLEYKLSAPGLNQANDLLKNM